MLLTRSRCCSQKSLLLLKKKALYLLLSDEGHLYPQMGVFLMILKNTPIWGYYRYFIVL